MENEGKNQRATATTTTTITSRVGESDFLLRWGNRKRLGCLKVKEDEDPSEKSHSNAAGVIRKKITSRVDRRVVRTIMEKITSGDGVVNNIRIRSRSTENLKSHQLSYFPERYYTTRGSMGVDENGKNLMDVREEEKAMVWPKLFVSLSSKEKEEDFMAMKGCKLPHRPKKRAKLIQKTLLLVSPGVWLSDLCKERYEVREKKTSKKRPRGLKAMGSMESDSE